MGNAVSVDEMNKMNTVLDKIFSMDFPVLDLGGRMGQTGYIDFIDDAELGEYKVVKGIDSIGRRFLVLKCEIAGDPDPDAQYCITFFQRYNDRSVTYHFTENLRKCLITSEGGASIDQMLGLLSLLENGKIALDYDRSKLLRILYRDLYEMTDEDKANVNDIVQLGWTPKSNVDTIFTKLHEISQASDLSQN